MAVARDLRQPCLVAWMRLIADDRIVASADKRVAAQKTGTRHPAAAQNSIPVDCLHRILGAGRDVAAGWWKHRRYRPLIGAEQLKYDAFCEIAHVFYRSEPNSSEPGLVALLLPTFCSTTTKARRISFRTASKSAASNDFFGLMTTSAPTC